MSVYHQMGHHSKNLISNPDLSGYAGAILSPVNYSQDEVAAQVQEHKSNTFSMVFDCQLYYPKADCGKLPLWSYFPDDVETADLSSSVWWNGLINDVCDSVASIQPSAVASPATVAGHFNDDYYSLILDVAHEMQSLLSGEEIEVIPTLLVRIDDLGNPDRAMEIASIVTGASFNRVYLVLVTSVDPRRELRDPDHLIGAMQLIRCLEENGIRLLVGFTSTDIALWKFAGAADCATGKFFNLRRFTSSRFDPPSGGGGQIAYWTEENLLSYVRESDLIRLRNANLLSSESSSSISGANILAKLDEGQGAPWLSDSWSQYMAWFSSLERRISEGVLSVPQLLADADGFWSQVDALGIFMEERQNDGNWIRAWRRCVTGAF